MRIRLATENDKEQLALLSSETFWQAYRTESELEAKYLRAHMAKAFSVQQIKSELLDPEVDYVLAEDESLPIGYAKLSFASDHPSLSGTRPMEICRIYLTKSNWGKGLGRQLLEYCVDRARTRSCDSVWLGVWHKNERAIGFYKKLGFEIVGEVEFDLASSIQKDHVMERLVANRNQ